MRGISRELRRTRFLGGGDGDRRRRVCDRVWLLVRARYRGGDEAEEYAEPEPKLELGRVIDGYVDDRCRLEEELDSSVAV